MNLIEIETSKITPKGPKGGKRPQKEPVKKQKVRAVHPKPKLIVYMSRSQSQNSPKGPKKGTKGPIWG